MATSVFSAAPDNSSTANFRAWGKGLSDALTAVGVLKTADTGQIDWTTVAAPGAINTFMGYEIRTLSTPSGAVIYFKIEFGSYAAIARPAIRITVGYATSGAGAITSNLSDVFTFGSNANSTTLYNCAVSGDTSRLSFNMFETAASPIPFCFSIARRKNDDGSDASTGVNIAFAGYDSTIGQTAKQQMLPTPAIGSKHPSPAYTGHVIDGMPPTGSGAYGTDIGVWPIKVGEGFSGNPDCGLLWYDTTNFPTPGTVIDVTIYAAVLHFRLLGPMGYNPQGASNKAPAIRYD